MIGVYRRRRSRQPELVMAAVVSFTGVLFWIDSFPQLATRRSILTDRPTTDDTLSRNT